jgi:ATP-binding cassette subfamily B protein
MPFYSRPEAQSLPEELSRDMEAVSGAWGTGISGGLMPALHSLFFAGLLFWISRRAGFAALLFWPWTLLSPRLFVRRISAVRQDLREAAGPPPGPEEESVRAQPVIRAFALEQMFTTSFRKRGRLATALTARADFVSALAERLPALGTMLLQFVMICLGFLFLSEKTITPARMATLTLAVVLLGDALARLGAWLMALSGARCALESITDRLDDPEAVLDSPDAKPFRGLQNEIAFDNVQAGITVRIPRGACVAFVGASGAGKTALLNLLLRFENAGTGVVTIDGSDVQIFSRASLRSQIGLVPQDRSIFNISLLENIRLGRADASAEAIVDAAKAAGLDVLLAAMPRGFDTMAGVNGSSLGAEAAQRLSLARALIRTPGILLLDEVGYDLDPLAEAALQRTIQRVAAGRTVIVAASRLSAVMHADRIFVLSEGRVVEQGSHEDLLTAGGFYAALREKQGGFRFSADGRHVTVEAARLQLLPDFENLNAAIRTELANRFATEIFPAGREIIREGDPTDKLYILVRGTAQTWRVDKESSVLQDGDYFGASMGTVRTLTACTCISLERFHFQELVTARVIRRAASA